MKVEDCFDKDGNFINVERQDPYRCDRKNNPVYLALFDEDGYAISVDEVYALIKKHNWTFSCDAVKYYYSSDIDHGCKGNYTAIYAWR